MRPKGSPKTPGSGRKAGTPNVNSKALREMILGALDAKGGQAYLERQADEHPTAFMTLIGKVLPMQVTGEDGGGVKAGLEIDADRAAASIMELIRAASERASKC
jgi:hypothetical protein